MIVYIFTGALSVDPLNYAQVQLAYYILAFKACWGQTLELVGGEKKESYNFDTRWVETASIQTHCCVTTLAWSNDSFRLLTAGDVIQLWEHKQIGESVNRKMGMSLDILQFI